NSNRTLVNGDQITNVLMLLPSTKFGPSSEPAAWRNSGNSISTLVNGDQIFPAMLSAIRSARRSVNFETYTFQDGEIAKQFTDALVDATRRRVKVNAVLDARGTDRMGRENAERLRSAGVNVVKYHRSLFPDPR